MNLQHGWHLLDKQTAREWPKPQAKAYALRLAELRALVKPQDDPGGILAGIAAQVARLEVLTATVGASAAANGASTDVTDLYLRAEGTLGRAYERAAKYLGRKPSPRDLREVLAEVSEGETPPGNSESADIGRITSNSDALTSAGDAAGDLPSDLQTCRDGTVAPKREIAAAADAGDSPPDSGAAPLVIPQPDTAEAAPGDSPKPKGGEI